MSPVDLVVATLEVHARLGWAASVRLLFVLGDIAGFFSHLYTDLTLFALAMSTFFFAWAAILYGASGTSGNERTKQHALSALHAALVGLALALLAGTIAAIVSTAAAGQ